MDCSDSWATTLGGLHIGFMSELASNDPSAVMRRPFRVAADPVLMILSASKGDEALGMAETHVLGTTHGV